MLKKILHLPPSVLGLHASGRLTREDYESILVPMLENEHSLGHRVRFLYQFGPEFSGFTLGAALDDFRVGLKYLRLFERCAIVADTEWIRQATQIFSSLMPCPVKVFNNEQFKDAVDWLASPDSESKLQFEMRGDGVLIVRPQGPLSREDFDKLSSTVDPWIETYHRLLGLVVCIKKFPGWENVGSFIHHIQFVSSHHRKIRRVAIAVDGLLPELMTKMASHFVAAEIKQFPFDRVQDATAWAGEETQAPKERSKMTESSRVPPVAPEAKTGR